MKDGGGLYVPKPDQGARIQIGALRDAGRMADAELIQSMVETPQAVWVTSASPKRVEQSVKATLKQAKGSVAVLVAYNIPGRDCGGLSAGGAQTVAEYEAWIDGFAAGIGSSPAIVILEPDALGLLPSNCGAGFPFSDADRFAELNYAVDKLAAQPNTKVYLDATHSAWLNVGENATRLLAAGVQRAAGFYLNVSNYQFAPNLVQYGTWVSDCIARKSVGNNDCPVQYWNVGPESPLCGHDTDHPLRDRHEPEWRRPVAVTGEHLYGSAGLVQPAESRARDPAHARHGRSAGRCLPVDQDPGRIRWDLHPWRGSGLG